MALNFPNNPQINDTYTADNNTWSWDGVAWNVAYGIPQAEIKTFTTIEVDGQSNIAATAVNDTLEVIAGANITLTTDAVNNALTISATSSEGGGAASNSFSTISVSGQSNVVADSATDTLTLAAGTGISITTNATSDTVTITNTALAGVTAFTGLSDAAGLTVDKFYLPAITMLSVTNSGASAYRFDQYGSTNNPTVYAINGTTIAFNLNISGHPFLIQNAGGANYSVGLIHVSTDGTVTTGASAQGKTSGTLYWKIPTEISGGYRYQCSVHGPMVGSISIKTLATL